MYTAPQDTFDRRVLDQPHYWLTRTGEILEPLQMSRAHLHNTLAMLETMAPLLHMDAMLDLLTGPPEGLVGELLAYELTGSCLGTLSAEAWLAATPLVRALRAELASRDVIDPDPFYCYPEPPTTEAPGGTATSR